MTPARFRWGMVLIQIGILILLRNANVIGDNIWIELGILFPVVLIAVGVEKIFTKSKLQFISYLTTVGIFCGGFLIAFAGSAISYEDNFFASSFYQEEIRPEVKSIKAVLNLDQSDLTIRDAGVDLILTEFDEFSRKPEINSYVENNIAYIDMTARDNSFLGGVIKIDNGDASDWNVQFAENLPLDLECYGFDDKMHLNLSTSRLERLKLDVDNSTIYLKIGDSEPMVKIIIKGDESKLRLRIPEKIGLKIFGIDYQTYLEQIGLKKIDDDSFINDQYDSTGNKIEIELDDRLDSFSLDYF